MRARIKIIIATVATISFSVAAFAAEAPDDRATPGAITPAVTQSNIDETICHRGWTSTIRPPEKYTYRLKRAQLHRPSSPYVAAGSPLP